jgi:hypothetical protein
MEPVRRSLSLPLLGSDLSFQYSTTLGHRHPRTLYISARPTQKHPDSADQVATWYCSTTSTRSYSTFQDLP